MGVKTSSADRGEALMYAQRIVTDRDAGDSLSWIYEERVTEIVNLARSYLDLDETAREFLDRQERPKMPDAKLVAENKWHRAGGRCICETCGFEYLDHDTVKGFRWLHRLCDGRLVKL